MTTENAPTNTQGMEDANAKDSQLVAPHPSDVIPGFPDVDWSMKGKEVLAVLESEGYFPENMEPTHVAWEGDFDGMDGRGTISLREPSGVVLIGVEIPLAPTEEEVADKWEERLEEAYGSNFDEVHEEEWFEKYWTINEETKLRYFRSSDGEIRFEWRKANI